MTASITKYHRKGFGLKDEVQGVLRQEYESDLIASLRSNGNQLSIGAVTIKLAEAFGFCWGVDRAVSMAYETRKHFPDKRIWITNEIIHNPLVNSKLKGMAVDFIQIDQDGLKDFSPVHEGDVVIVPAFGASADEMRILEERGCEIVDTTCPWVSRVWNRIVKYGQNDFTAIIHGKPRHEETIATASRARHYLIVQDFNEARAACDYILGKQDKAAFDAMFNGKTSKGFDPARHLKRVGIANQTTMLKGETEEIGKLFERTMLEKYGPQELDQHFLSPGDTICNATEERQEAMLKLVKEELDVILVVGGFNSSNTGHLFEIAVQSGVPSYHIDTPDCIGPGNVIRHRPLHAQECIETGPWLPPGHLTIGITSGASTPDQVVALTIARLVEIKSALEAS